MGNREKALDLTLTPGGRYIDGSNPLKVPSNLHSRASSAFHTSTFTRANEQSDYWGDHSNLRALKHRTLVPEQARNRLKRIQMDPSSDGTGL